MLLSESTHAARYHAATSGEDGKTRRSKPQAGSRSASEIAKPPASAIQENRWRQAQGLRSGRTRKSGGDPATSRSTLSRGDVRFTPQDYLGDAGCDHPLGAVNRCARKHG